MQDLLNKLIGFVQANPMIGAAVGVSATGLISWWIKDFPKKLLYYLKSHLTTELVVTSSNLFYHEMLKWIGYKYKHKNFRKLKITNGKRGYDDTATTSIGYGRHFIRYKKTIFLLNLSKEESNQSEYDKETIYITKLGRNRKSFDEFIDNITKLSDLDSNKTKLYKMEHNWSYIKKQPKRELKSIFIEKEKKELLVNSISNFINKEEYYIENGIPYQLGILLYGSPGTGKTSLIKAIAAYLDYSIYYLPSRDLDKIEIAMMNLPDKCIVVIEDIDGNKLTHERSLSANKESKIKVVDGFSFISLSELLNALDGMFSAHGRILIATTNHIDALDKALIRPGRIDLKIEIGFVNKEILKEFLDSFYPNNKIQYESFTTKDGITVAQLQNMVLQNKTEYDILDFVKNK